MSPSQLLCLADGVIVIDLKVVLRLTLDKVYTVIFIDDKYYNLLSVKLSIYSVHDDSKFSKGSNKRCMKVCRITPDS